jgi:cytochrome P450
MIDYMLRKNPLIVYLSKLGLESAKLSPTVPFAANNIKKRLLALEKGEAPNDDLLSKFLTAQRENPTIVTDEAVFGMTLSMVNAGSDTTATSLAALFYHLLKNPERYHKLQSEIDSTLGEKNSSTTFRTAQTMPYLDACVKEGFRIHPALSIPQERVTPPSGAMVAGIWVPGDTVVACNPWTINRNKEIFGEDATLFRPERWLENNEKRVREMNSTLFQFGAGAHLCIGKNIALMEIYKLVPNFLRKFHVSYRAQSCSAA